MILPAILAVGALAALPAACRPVTGPPGVDGILVVSDRGGAARIYELDPDGTARLVGSADAGDRSHADGMPARLPDGRVVFVSDRDGSPSIYLASAGGDSAIRLLPAPAGAGERSDTAEGTGDPAVAFADVEPSPLGRDAILFTRRPPGGPGDLYTVKLDGSGLRRLTRHPADDRAPAASTDGRSIAFVSDRGGAPRIYLLTNLADADPDAAAVDLTGGAIEPRLPPGVRLRDDGPVFLPDGSIAFSRGVEGGLSHIFVMGAAGAAAGLRQVTDSITLPFGAG